MARVIVNVPDTRSSFEAVQADEMALEQDMAVIELGPMWEGVLAIEEEMTGDGRMFEAGAVRWETLPVPLRWVKEDTGQHMGAVVVGRIDDVYRDGNKIMGSGVFDLGSVEGREAARQVAAGLTPGISVDLDDVSFEIRVRSELMQPMVDLTQLGESDETGMTVVMEASPDDEIMVTTDARLRAATIVATPAFAEARIQLTVEYGYDEEKASSEPMLVASAVMAEVRPPQSWFDDPKLTGPTALTITEDGRIYGHLATWGTCHTGFVGECVQPPSSATNYAFFRTGVVTTKEGKDVPVGRITMDTTHAGRRLGPADTSSHYDHTGRAVADVAAGEDPYGIWVAGSVRPGLTEEQLRTLKASPLSGDWRRVGGNLELVAALAVNSPGFPIPRVLVSSGSVQTLQSPNVVSRITDDIRDASQVDDLALQRLLNRERASMDHERKMALNARNRVLVASAAARMAAIRR